MVKLLKMLLKHFDVGTEDFKSKHTKDSSGHLMLHVHMKYLQLFQHIKTVQDN